MPKTKQQKQKEREKRVAKEKLEAAAQRRAQEKFDAENKPPASQMTKHIAEESVAKPKSVVKTAKASFAHRRSGGG